MDIIWLKVSVILILIIWNGYKLTNKEINHDTWWIVTILIIMGGFSR